MAPIQFGYILPAEIRDLCDRSTHLDSLHRALEMISGKFDSAWMIDHLQDVETGLLEGFSTIAFMAGKYPLLKFGNTALSQSFRNPALQR